MTLARSAVADITHADAARLLADVSADDADAQAALAALLAGPLASSPYSAGVRACAVGDRVAQRKERAADATRVVDACMGTIATGDPAAWATLRELLERPELLAEPEAVIPRLAYRGRTTLLAAPEKAGKTTYVTRAVAKLTRGGWWLGEQLKVGRVIIAAPDEALGDTVRRLATCGADADRVYLLQHTPTDLLASLRGALEQWGDADVVIIDSLAEWARLASGGTAPEMGDASGWGTIVRALVALAREYNIALILLHHTRRADNQYRGSGELGAAVDCILTMTEPATGEDATMRRFKARARFPLAPYAVALRDHGYELVGGADLPLSTRVLVYIEEHPGTSTTAVREGVSGRATAIDTAIRTLEERGAIRRARGRLYPPSGQVAMEGT